MISKQVKLIENAIGPLNQFRVTPLKNPRVPCSRYKSLTMLDMEGGWSGAIARVAAITVEFFPLCVTAFPTTSTAASFPLVATMPIVCILRLVTSSGYVTVWAKSPDKAPHCMRSIVVKSLPVIL